jgi:hypothetical protein
VHKLVPNFDGGACICVHKLMPDFDGGFCTVVHKLMPIFDGGIGIFVHKLMPNFDGDICTFVHRWVRNVTRLLSSPYLLCPAAWMRHTLVVNRIPPPGGYDKCKPYDR